jgi:hypothetical protein
MVSKILAIGYKCKNHDNFYKLIDIRFCND